MRKVTSLVVLIALVSVALGWYWHSNSETNTLYRTAVVRRGDLVTTINATGTLEPEEVVDVGAQVAGLIVSFGKDANGEARSTTARPSSQTWCWPASTTRSTKPTSTPPMHSSTRRKANLQKGQADVGRRAPSCSRPSRTGIARSRWARRTRCRRAITTCTRPTYEVGRGERGRSRSARSPRRKSGIAAAQAALDKARRNLDFCASARR